MKLDVEFPELWRQISEERGIALSDIVYGYAVEQLMLRLSESDFFNNLWLNNEEVLGEEAYGRNVKERLHFFYIDNESKQTLKNVAEQIAEEFICVDESELQWIYHIEEKDGVYHIHLEGQFRQMRIPVVLIVEAAPVQVKSPKRKELSLLYSKIKSCPYLVYSKENFLAEQLFEILRKMELISDMEPYFVVTEILKANTISGRHIMEDFHALAEAEPKMASVKRLSQLESYHSYGYMKKKWEQYEKRHGKIHEDWNAVLERICAFLRPTWKALCDNEIFFGDWMPELGRFLD